MSFRPTLEAWPPERLEALFAEIGPADVDAALHRADRGPRDLAALLSPHARPRLEEMARIAQGLTRQHFGRTISLYAPLYLSNLCAADCVYCCFSARNPTRDRRITLKPDELRRECEALAARGFQSVLLLTGEAPRAVTVDYIAECVGIAREHFASVSAEIYALDGPDYERLIARGLEGVTLYMETYHRPVYAQVHLEGEKANYDFRLDAIERAGHAGARKLNIGALLGLYNWRHEAVWTALHARHLQRSCWQSAAGVSFPRLLHTPSRFQAPVSVSDAELVQLLLAMRLFLPEAGFNLSTRERPSLRDRLIPLGVTHMSAGSSTQPGGYATHASQGNGSGREVLEQFEIEDLREPSEVVAAIRAAGYDPVWKDFDHAFDPA